MELHNDEAAIRELPPVPADPSAGARAKALQMPDESMEPRIKRGDLLLFDPDRLPTPKCVVLVATGDGQHLVRMYRVRSAKVWEAVAENDGYATLTSDAEQLRVVAVATGRWQSEF
jgi:SOS-response transcriptional repressor LexA